VHCIDGLALGYDARAASDRFDLLALGHDPDAPVECLSEQLRSGGLGARGEL
jgi:hypothetical protein